MVKYRAAILSFLKLKALYFTMFDIVHWEEVDKLHRLKYCIIFYWPAWIIYHQSNSRISTLHHLPLAKILASITSNIFFNSRKTKFIRRFGFFLEREKLLPKSSIACNVSNVRMYQDPRKSWQKRKIFRSPWGLDSYYVLTYRSKSNKFRSG